MKCDKANWIQIMFLFFNVTNYFDGAALESVDPFYPTLEEGSTLWRGGSGY